MCRYGFTWWWFCNAQLGNSDDGQRRLLNVYLICALRAVGSQKSPVVSCITVAQPSHGRNWSTIYTVLHVSTDRTAIVVGMSASLRMRVRMWPGITTISLFFDHEGHGGLSSIQVRVRLHSDGSHASHGCTWEHMTKSAEFRCVPLVFRGLWWSNWLVYG